MPLPTMADIKLEMMISNMILEVARAAQYGDVTNGDLQGMAEAKAINIINYFKTEKLRGF